MKIHSILFAIVTFVSVGVWANAAPADATTSPSQPAGQEQAGKHHHKNQGGKNHQKREGGKNRRGKPGGKNRHGKHGGKGHQKKHGGKNHHKKPHHKK